MRNTGPYTVLGIAVVAVVSVFVVFGDEAFEDYDHTGIVSDVRESSSGYTFTLNMSDGSGIRCFCREEPVRLGYYAVAGEYSDDGSMLFISFMRNLDTDPL